MNRADEIRAIMDEERANAAARALALAALEGRDYTLWLAGPGRWVVTSSREGDETHIDTFYARVKPDGTWSGPGAARVEIPR